MVISGKQIAQPAAGLGDLQLVASEIDDVALEEHADIEQPHEVDADLGGQQLQLGR
jgi:hypothetical protein